MFGNFIICIMVWRFYTWHASLQLVGMLDLVPMRSRNSRFFFSKKMWRKDTTNKTINNFFYSQQNLISIHLEDHFLDSISHSAWRRRRRYGTHFQVNTNHTPIHIGRSHDHNIRLCTNSLLVSRRVEEGCALCTINLYLSHNFSLMSSCLMILNSSFFLLTFYYFCSFWLAH